MRFPISALGLLLVSTAVAAKKDRAFFKLKSCLIHSDVSEKNLISRDNQSDSEAYKQLNFQWNKCCGHKTPMAYLLAQTAADVRLAIKCAKSVGDVRVVARGGGHSFGKYSFGDSKTLVVDLQNMSRIMVDQSTRTVNIEPGALLGQVMWELYNSGKFGLPYGKCPTVGIGFVLGGGFGDFSRLHGMASDSLREVDIIDAKGKKLTANMTTNSDLFWALRGGGAGSFGIVTRFKFEMFVAPAQVVSGTVKYKFEDFPQVFAAFQTYLATNPPERYNVLLWLLDNTITLILVDLQSTGGTTHAVTNILTSRFPPGSQPPNLESISFLDYLPKPGKVSGSNITVPSQLAMLGRHSHNLTDGPLMAKSFYVTKTISNLQTVQLFALLDHQRPQGSIVLLQGQGGAIDKVSQSSTAFVHRLKLYEFDMEYHGPKEKTAESRRWMNAFFFKTKLIFGHTESYQGHLDIDLPDYLERYYANNLPRLMEIKKKYDPANYFSNPQSIPPAFVVG